MKALDLYKYINDNDIEWRWIIHNNGEPDVIIFIYYFQLEGFVRLLSAIDFDDDGINCVLKDNYVAIHMEDICEIHDIELQEVFPKNEEEQ